MSAKPMCQTCQIEMEHGFIADLTHHGTARLPTWSPGTPKQTFWFGAALADQAKDGHKVITYRCPKCFALTMYAPPPSK